MLTSLQSLLARIIDYAGFFSPANLPAPTTLANYHRYRQSSDGWLLGRLLIPASRLNELRLLLPQNNWIQPLELAVIGRGGRTSAECLENLALDLEKIATARAEHGNQIQIDVLEVPLPRDPGLNPLLREASEQAYQSQLLPFFEIPMAQSSGEPLSQAIRACLSSGRAGLKLRCGNDQPTRIPPVEIVAQFISECTLSRVPMKFTAGLHHPLVHQTGRPPALEHGFINVFLAAVLALEHGLAQPMVCKILREENARAFHWEVNTIGWGEYRCHSTEVELARRFAAVSFGSCDFEKPCADLRELQWI